MGAHSAPRGRRREARRAAPEAVHAAAHAGARRARRARGSSHVLRDRLLYVLVLAVFGFAGWWLNPHVKGLLGLLPKWPSVAVDAVVVLSLLAAMSVPRGKRARGVGGVLTVLLSPGFVTHAFMLFGGDALIAEIIFDFALSVELVFFIGLVAVIDGVGRPDPALLEGEG